jgi:hypothetical protein
MRSGEVAVGLDVGARAVALGQQAVCRRLAMFARHRLMALHGGLLRVRGTQAEHAGHGKCESESTHPVFSVATRDRWSAGFVGGGRLFDKIFAPNGELEA